MGYYTSNQFYLSDCGLAFPVAIQLVRNRLQVLMTNGIKASNSREQAQEAEITILKDLVENQQSRLHRMQKELQFLVTRQKVSHFKLIIVADDLYIT
jgi:hypothetical protein